MNVKLQYELEFTAGLYFDSRLLFNNYTVQMTLLTQTTITQNSNVALERVRAFVDYELAHTVFLGPNDHAKAKLLVSLGINVTTLPEDPVDQIIGLMLFSKFNAVMEKRMLVTSLDVSSVLGDRVWYMHNEDDPLGPFVHEGWWSRPGRQHTDLNLINDNVVKVSAASWGEWNLDWPESSSTNGGNTVLYANFVQNETQQPQ